MHALTLAGLIITFTGFAGWLAWFHLVARHDDGPEPRHVRRDDNQAERESMARLRGGDYGPGVTPVDVGGQLVHLPPFPPAPVPARQADTMVPDPGLLPPLPAFTPKVQVSVTADDSQFQAKLAEVKAQLDELAPPPAEPPAHAGGNGHHDLMERFERLIGDDPRPAYWVEATNGHVDNARLLESIVHRALTPDVLALLDAAKEAGNG